MSKTIMLFAAALSLAVSGRPGSATAATIFTDLASYETALGGPSTLVDDYNEFNEFAIIEPPIDRGSYVMNDELGDMFFSSGGNNIVGTGYMGFGQGTIGGSGITFDFDQAITAVAFEHRMGTPPQTLRVTNSGFTEDITVTETAGFFGVIFDAPETSVDFLNVLANRQFGLDNLRAEVVPEPSTAALFALGLAGCALVRRRSRSIS